MDKREKVIQAFENCTDPLMNDDETCIDCIRAGECPWDDCQERDSKLIDIPLSLAMAALELLKPAKAIRMHNTKVSDVGEKVFVAVCNNCSGYLCEGWKACPICGKAVKWDAPD